LTRKNIAKAEENSTLSRHHQLTKEKNGFFGVCTYKATTFVCLRKYLGKNGEKLKKQGKYIKNRRIIQRNI
jgi:hypothetical protein